MERFVIPEDEVLQVFDSRRNRGDIDNVSPCKDRRRSVTLYASGLSSPPKNKLLLEAQIVSSELLLSNIESLPKAYRRSNRRLRRLNTELLEALQNSNYLECQKLLQAGANPNATCQRNYVSAVHLAAMYSEKILRLLLEQCAEKHRTDKFGRTPLHIAAWAGNLINIGLLLEFPKELQNKLAQEKQLTQEIEEEIKKLAPTLKNMVNIRCELGKRERNVSKDLIDTCNIESNVAYCSFIGEKLPRILLGWTPLHAASCSARASSIRMLLAAGADPCVRDEISRSPFDVIGYAYYNKQNGEKQNTSAIPNCADFTEVIRILLSTEGSISLKMQKQANIDTPLHIAVELESLDAIVMLLNAGASISCLNRSGMTPMHLCVKKRLKAHLQAFFIFSNDQTDNTKELSVADFTDKDGITVLHFAVLHGWLDGACLALEAGANNVNSEASNGETPLHSAVDLGNIEILKEILSYSSPYKVIDTCNILGETPLMKAVMKGHEDCVKLLLIHGASMTKTLPEKINVIHKASKLGHFDVLKVLFDFDDIKTRAIVNYSCRTGRGFGPIHYAVENNHSDCLKLLLSKKADVNLKSHGYKYKGATPLHIAAKKNNVEIAKIILEIDKTTLNKDAFGWTPLHTASYYGSRDVIVLLLKEGADLSTQTDVNNTKTTPIEMLMNHLTNPTEFLEEIFDSCITSYGVNPEDPDREINVDYGILIPGISQSDYCGTEMKVIEALSKTGNRAGQRRLLLHPLIESFVCLKWRAFVSFFYVIVFLYGLFSVSLMSYILSVFYYVDKNKPPPMWLDKEASSCSVYMFVVLILFIESFYIKISKQYLLRIELWIKFSSLTMGMILLNVLKTDAPAEDWQRHMATMAVLFCWLEMTLLLSRFPKCGYYVLMFAKVSINVLKILLTFTFLIAGFALCFMLEFKSAPPFDSPWAALVKTMVMMTSEFDYNDLIDRNNPDIDHSYNTIRLLFLIFLFLAAIVLMNLMVGVAVNDLNNLEVFGNITRLERQVEFLASLETLKNLMKSMPDLALMNLNFTLTIIENISSITLRRSNSSSKFYKAIPYGIREAIFEKAQSKKKEMAV